MYPWGHRNNHLCLFRIKHIYSITVFGNIRFNFEKKITSVIVSECTIGLLSQAPSMRHKTQLVHFNVHHSTLTLRMSDLKLPGNAPGSGASKYTAHLQTMWRDRPWQRTGRSEISWKLDASDIFLLLHFLVAWSLPVESVFDMWCLPFLEAYVHHLQNHTQSVSAGSLDKHAQPISTG